MNYETEINLEKIDGVTIFYIHGDITAFSEPFFNEAYKKVNEQETCKILLKFHENAYINSSGLGVLFKLLAEAKGKNQKIFITGLSGHFQKIFNIVGITKFAKIYKSMEEAMADISG